MAVRTVTTPTTDRVLTVPNVLSLLRLATVPVFIWLFLNDRENAAVILYGAGAWTDFFDGVIARRFGQVSALGKLLDPLADRVFIIAMAVALVARGTLPWPLAVIVIARDLILLSLFPLLERRKIERIAVNRIGKLATAALLFGLTWLLLSETTFGWAQLGEEIGLPFVILGALLYWVAGGLYAREALSKLRALAGGS